MSVTHLLKFEMHAILECLSFLSLSYQGWCQEFSDGGMTLLMMGLKYGFQGTINDKDL